jgi:hypothetical protein
MKGLHLALMLALLAGFLVLKSCGSTQSMALNSAQLTNELRPGMSYDEVEQLLGKPKSSQMTNNQWIVRWTLQEMWKGYVPYDMVFDPATQSLVSWSSNEEDYQKNQEQLGALANALEQSNASASGESGGNASPTGPNDPQLMQQFAGTYYSFSAVGGGQTGGTERSVTLCPDGSFYESSETGYSGGAGTSGAWGSAGQGGSKGTWRIMGNMNEGTLTTVSASGSATEYKYSRCGSDCVYFGNNKFAYAGPPNCR